METEQTNHPAPVIAVGAGFVGLPYAVALARGYFQAGPARVILSERSEERLKHIQTALQTGSDPLGESHLFEEMTHLSKSELTLCTDPVAELIKQQRPRAIVIAINTPTTTARSITALSGSGLDCSGLYELCESIADALSDEGEEIPVIIRSTIPPEVARILEIVFIENNSRAVPYFVPEFLREGRALSDIAVPDRVVIGQRHGSLAERELPIDREVLSMLFPKAITSLVHWMLPEEACLVKLGANALLAHKIAFAGKIASYVEETLAAGDAGRILAAIGGDDRIGKGALGMGLGPAGPCLPKDRACFSSVVGSVDPGSELYKGARWGIENKSDQGSTQNTAPVFAIGIGFKPISSDWRAGQPLALLRNVRRTKQSQINIWDPRLQTADLQALSAEFPEGEFAILGAGTRPAEFPPGSSVYLFMHVTAELLGCLRSVSVFDPYALLTEQQVVGLRNRDCTYKGRGRGAHWAQLPEGE